MQFLSGESREIQDRFATLMEEASADLNFEKAARYRDRISALARVQAEQNLHGNEIGNADVIAIASEGATSCIEIFFYRGGQSYGNRAYFPRHEKTDAPEEILGAFVAQFYSNKPAPRDIYLSQEIPEQELIGHALSTQNDAAVSIHVPERGRKKQIVKHVHDNAKQALKRKMGSTMAQSKLMSQIAEVFDLAAPPERIEIYDNSHIQGAHPIGAMVVATPDGFAKNHYRKFNIKNEDIWGDDFAMMKEVFSRRFGRAMQEDPDRTSGTWPD